MLTSLKLVLAGDTTPPTGTPSTLTWIGCTKGETQQPRRAAWNESVYPPAFRLSVWLMLPVACTNAVWLPSGAAAAPQALPLPWMPLLLAKAQPIPEVLGLY